MAKKELESKISGRKPSNEVDVCGPKSGETGRPSIKRSGIDPCDPVFDAIDQFFSAQLSVNESEATLLARTSNAPPRNSPRHTPTPSPSNTVSPSPSWRKRKR